MPERHRIGRAAGAVTWTILGLAVVGCSSTWNERERQTIRQSLDRVNAAAEASKAEAARPAAPAPPAPVRTGEVEMTLFDALRTALTANQDVQIAGFTPLLAETDMVRARAVYDPTVFLSDSHGRNKRPIQSRLEGTTGIDSALIEDTWSMKGGVKQRVPTGGTLAVFQTMSYLDTNNLSTIPKTQYTSGLAAELSQPLLQGFGDVVGRATIRIASLSADISLEDFRQKVMEVATRVVSAYWQLAFDREMLRVSRDSLHMAQDVLRNEQARAGQTLSSQLNVARAASAASTRKTDVLRAGNRVRNSEDQLKRLMNSPDIPVDADVRVVPVEAPQFFLVDVDRSACMTRALSRRPELERARTTLDINRIRIDVADRQRLPKLDAMLRYTLNGMDTTLGDSLDMLHITDPITWVAGIEFELPLGNRAAQAEHQRRRVEYEQALLEADRLTGQVLTEVSLAVRSVLQGRDEVEYSSQARDAAKRVVDLEPVRAELGALDTRNNDEMLRAQETWAAAERDYLAALLNFNLALTELARAQGTLIEDNGVEVVWPEADRPGRLMPVGLRVPEKPPTPPSPAAPSAPAAPAPAEKAPATPPAPAPP
ncbi:MAG: TolC family protein, partial [Planctomycetes bacterium]|nr:TolC family protein [Planctomycetota bacterium]